MAILPIYIYGDPVLHKPTEPIELDENNKPSPEIVSFIDDLFETMDAARGVGLSSNQVGVSKRVFVYDCPENDRSDKEHLRGELINPVLEISERPETMPDPDYDEEGCLSLPGLWYPVGRAKWAKATGYDRNGNKVVFESTGFFGKMLQHEIDHLDGVFFTERLIGRHARRAKKDLKRNKIGEPGITWLPGQQKVEYER